MLTKQELNHATRNETQGSKAVVDGFQVNGDEPDGEGGRAGVGNDDFGAMGGEDLPDSGIQMGSPVM